MNQPNVRIKYTRGLMPYTTRITRECEITTTQAVELDRAEVGGVWFSNLGLEPGTKLSIRADGAHVVGYREQL